jgi:CYTH domain-containing protein
LVATHNGTEKTIYIDGATAATLSGDWLGATSTTEMLIGKAAVNGWFSGMMDEVRISDIGRTPAWVRLSYETQKLQCSSIVVPLNAPSQLICALVDSGAIRIAYPTGVAIDNIEIQRSFALEGDEWQTIYKGAASGGVYTDAKTACGADYKYRLRYNDGLSYSDWSAAVQFSMPDCYEMTDLYELSAMVIDQHGEPINSTSSEVEVTFYNQKENGAVLGSFETQAPVTHGWLSVMLGKEVAARNIIKDHVLVYAELKVDDEAQEPRIPLTTNGIQDLVNPNMLKGRGSPIGSVHGGIGALYTDISAKKLYFKYGIAINDWKIVQ